MRTKMCKLRKHVYIDVLFFVMETARIAELTAALLSARHLTRFSFG